MKLRVAQRAAAKILIGLLTLVILFHIGVIFKLFPYGTVVGGRLTSDAQMYLLETVSILVNGFLIGVLLAQKGFIRHRVPPGVSRLILWVYLILFLLNTIGNVLANTAFEQGFALLTLLFVLLLWLILKKQ